MAVTLNAGQQAASNAIHEFLATEYDDSQIASKSYRYYSVTGAGGTGKTTTIFDALIPYIEQGHKVLLVAPTNKAVKVLREAAAKWGLSIDAMTMASALGLRMLPDEENKFAAKVGPAKLSQYSIIVADEASMYSKKSLDILEREIRNTEARVIFLGDDFQIPPVRETRSEAFDMACGNSELTQTERFKGPIQRIALMLRDCIANNKRPSIIEEEHDGENGSVFVKLGKKFNQELLSQIDVNTTPDDVRIIAWSNARVDELNNIVRTHLYGRKAAPFIVGERIVTTEAVKNMEDEVVMNTDEECIIKQVFDDHLIDPFDSHLSYRVTTLTVEPLLMPGTDEILHIIHPDDEDKLRERLSALAKRAKAANQWHNYWLFREMFNQVKHCWAITAHRSQGSTYKNVFVDVINICKNRKTFEMLRILYVSCSRPSGNLYLNRNRFVG